jgi:hypothetical protein
MHGISQNPKRSLKTLRRRLYIISRIIRRSKFYIKLKPGTAEKVSLQKNYA